MLGGWADTTWDVGRAFGTIGGRRDDLTVEVTTYRADAYDPESRKPVVAFGDNLEDDLFIGCQRDDFCAEPLDDHIARLCRELGMPEETALNWRDLPEPHQPEDHDPPDEAATAAPALADTS